MKLIFIILAFGLSFSLAAKMNGDVLTPAHSFFSTSYKFSTMNQEEIWKDVVGYEGLYQVSDFGRVKSLDMMAWNGISHWFKKGRILKINKTGRDYKKENGAYCSISIGGNKMSVHRLKAIAFIPNPENKPCINHRDGVKSNNGYHADGKDNLEWCTYSENEIHAHKIGLKITIPKFGMDNHSSIPVYRYSMIDKFIKRYECAAAASRELNIDHSSICKCCKNKVGSAGGYKWKYT